MAQPFAVEPTQGPGLTIPSLSSVTLHISISDYSAKCNRQLASR